MVIRALRFGFSVSAAALLGGCATEAVDSTQFRPLAGLTCQDLADEQQDVELFHDVIEAIDFEPAEAREKRAAKERVDAREVEIARAREAMRCS